MTYSYGLDSTYLIIEWCNINTTMYARRYYCLLHRILERFESCRENQA